MERKLIIVGAGSVGLHLAANAELYGIQNAVYGFVDDDISKIGQSFYGYPVLNKVDWLMNQNDLDVVVGIAFPKAKEKIVIQLKRNSTLHFPTLIANRNVWISNDCRIGMGTVIYPGCSINYGSKIGDFVVMNMNCALGHHAAIGNFASLAPGVNLAGHTTLEESVDMGIGSCSIQDVVIGRGAIIGGQTMVIHNLPPGVIAKGIPAKIRIDE